MTPQAAEAPPTGHDGLTKGAEGEEPVAIRTTTSGGIEVGKEFARGYRSNRRNLVRGRHWVMVDNQFLTMHISAYPLANPVQ